MNWVITLIMSPEQTISQRVLQIINFLVKKNETIVAHLKEFDGFGAKGDLLARISDANRNLFIYLPQDLLIEILEEDDQILEMDLEVEMGSDKFNIVVSDGSLIDVLGYGDRLPEEATGPYDDGNIDDFCPRCP